MKRLTVWLLACLTLLALAAGAAAAPRATLSDIEDEVMCPTCGTDLSLSESPLAQRQRTFIQRLIDQGRSKDEIKARLVDEFGPQVLASPPREGFSLTAYLVPVAALVLAIGSAAFALLRRRGRPSPPDDTSAGDSFDELVDTDLAGVRR